MRMGQKCPHTARYSFFRGETLWRDSTTASSSGVFFPYDFDYSGEVVIMPSVLTRIPPNLLSGSPTSTKPQLSNPLL